MSVELKATMKVNIHNQCSDLKLIGRGYFSTGTYWDKRPNDEVEADDMTNAKLIPSLATFEGILTYELEIKHVKPDNRRDPPHIRLFVAWKSEYYKQFRMFMHLIEYDEYVEWNEIKLKEYYHHYVNQLNAYTDSIKNTWLTCDGTVLMTGLELDFTQRDGVLNITISEGVKNEHSRRPAWFDPKM
jgi:hypothetical protein